MNTLNNKLIKTGLVALICGSAITYSCNNAQNKSNNNTNDKNIPKKEYTEDFKYTADQIGNRDKQASKEELQELDRLIGNAKPYNRLFMYQPFVIELDGTTHMVEPGTVGDHVLEIRPRSLEYTDSKGQTWGEIDFNNRYGVLEINMDGKLVATYMLTRRGTERKYE